MCVYKLLYTKNFLHNYIILLFTSLIYRLVGKVSVSITTYVEVFQPQKTDKNQPFSLIDGSGRQPNPYF